MKFVFTLLVLFWFFQVPAQKADDLAGTWQVSDVSLSDQFEYDDQTAAQLSQIAEALKGSQLELTKQGKAAFRTKVPQFLMESGTWSFDEEHGSLKLKSKGSNALMELLVFSDENGLLAYISESPFVLNLKRTDEN